MQDTFDQALEAVDHLSVDQQETLISIIRRRLAEKGRKRIAADIAQAHREHQQGLSKTTTVDELMKEILS